MRITFIGQPRDRISGRGAEASSVAIVLMALAHRLAERHEVHVVAPRSRGQAVKEVAPSGVWIERVPADWRLGQSGLEVVRGLDPNARPHLWREDYFARFCREAAAVVGRERPDIVHLMTLAQYGPALREASPSSRLVLHLHDAILARMDKAEAARMLAPFDRIVCCSDWLARALRDHLPERAEAIAAVPNGVDLDLFPRIEQGSSDEPRLISIGRVSPEKGPHVLIEAFVRLTERFTALRLDLVGGLGLFPLAKLRPLAEPGALAAAVPFYGRGPVDGLDRQILRPAARLRAALLANVPEALRDRVHLHGGVPQGRLIDLLRRATVFVQPSICAEGFGMPLAEAMATGMAAVASAAGGLQDLVRHGKTGLLVPPGDGAALADAIEGLLRDPAERERLGAAASARIRTSFTWDASAATLDAAYRGLG